MNSHGNVKTEHNVLRF